MMTYTVSHILREVSSGCQKPSKTGALTQKALWHVKHPEESIIVHRLTESASLRLAEEDSESRRELEREDGMPEELGPEEATA